METTNEVVEKAAEVKEQPQVAEKTEREFKKPSRRPNRKKVCVFCVEKAAIDYKDVARIKRFITENGKIFTGCNIENAGIQSICAERVAFVKELNLTLNIIHQCSCLVVRKDNVDYILKDRWEVCQ